MLCAIQNEPKHKQHLLVHMLDLELSFARSSKSAAEDQFSEYWPEKRKQRIRGLKVIEICKREDIRDEPEW